MTLWSLTFSVLGRKNILAGLITMSLTFWIISKIRSSRMVCGFCQAVALTFFLFLFFTFHSACNIMAKILILLTSCLSMQCWNNCYFCWNEHCFTLFSRLAVNFHEQTAFICIILIHTSGQWHPSSQKMCEKQDKMQTPLRYEHQVENGETNYTGVLSLYGYYITPHL